MQRIDGRPVAPAAAAMRSSARVGPKGLDRALRRLVPSTAALSRGRAFAVASRLVDAAVRPFWRLFTDRPVPPLRYIVRTGVGNNILFPPFYYLTVATDQWLYFFSRGFATLDSVVVDIGSGVGKSAVPLRDFRYGDRRFEGRYIGYDVDPEMVAWCSAHFPEDRFRFVHLDRHSSVYNPTGGGGRPRLDCADAGADFVLSQSLLSHLLEDDVEHYLAESYRVLRPGGALAMTFFCMEDLRRLDLLGGRWSFAHRMGRAHVESLRYPEAAVAYEAADILAMCRRIGFGTARVARPNFQSTLECIR